MKPGGQRVPSIVVIQERHVRHGENFKIFRTSCKSRREYIAKFLSPRRVTYRCRSRKVRIGCGMKETTYKGSPLAISRILILKGLDAKFPTFDELRKQMEPATSTPSYFNLSDRGTEVMNPHSKFPYSLKGLMGPSSSQMLDFSVEKKCTPESLSDFQLIFGSDTNEAEDFESDEDDQEKMAVEVLFDSSTPPDQQPVPAEVPGNQKDNNIIVSLARMEKDIKQIVNAFEANQGDVPSEPPRNSKPSMSVPPIPLAMRRSQGGGSQPPRTFEDVLQPTPSTSVQGGQNQPTNLQMHLPSPTSQYIFNTGSMGVPGPQLPFRNATASRALCGLVEPSGSIPFFRVPGGCFMVIHATNQTTPLLHATFVTGCLNALQFQQTQLPVYNSHQIVAIHFGPYRLCKEEVNGVFAFACGTKMYSPCNATR